MAQKIKSEEAIHGALRRQIVTGNFQGPNTLAKAGNTGYCDNRQVFRAAGGDDADPFFRSGRITADGNGHLRRNHGGRSSRIDDHAQRSTGSRTFEEWIRNQKRSQSVRHRRGLASEGRCVTRRQGVIRISHQRQTSSTQQRIMNFIATGRVSQQMSTQRSLGTRSHFIHSDQKPLPVELLSDFRDQLCFHDEGIIAQKELKARLVELEAKGKN